MTVLLPSKVVELPGGYRWAPQLVELEAWQAHLLKHPLGLRAVRELKQPWDYEAWSRAGLVDLADPKRQVLFQAVRANSSATQPCRVAEVFEAVHASEEPRPECYQCRAPLLERCHAVLVEREVSPRYARVTEAVVAALQGGEVVARKALAATLMRTARRMERWRDLVVMSVGNLGVGAGHGVRCSRGDGVRVELRVGKGGLSWRTTYRMPDVAERAGGWGFLVQPPDPAPELSLSDAYVVPRAWWQEHGS